MNNTNGWCPADYRAALESWRVSAPANDSDIMPAQRKAKTRHGSAAGKYRAVLTYRDPPSAEPLSSNWRTVPASDNRRPWIHSRNAASRSRQPLTRRSRGWRKSISMSGERPGLPAAGSNTCRVDGSIALSAKMSSGAPIGAARHS